MMKPDRVQQELRDHLERRAAELQSEGVGEAEARRQAAAEFGGLDAIAQAVRETWRLQWLREAATDARLAARSWRRSPGFAITAFLILALGIGVNLEMFGVLQATLLRPLPFPDGQQLIYLTELDNHGADQTFSIPDLRDFQAQMTSLSALGGYRDYGVTLTGGAGGSVLVPGRLMFAGTFEALGVRPVLGRWFTAQEHTPNGPPVAIITYGLWQSRFGGERSAVGKMLPTSNGPREIVGVMPATFSFDRRVQVYAPYEELAPALYFNDRANSFILYGVGRMRPEVSLAQAQDEAAAISARLSQQYPKSNATVHATATTLKLKLTGNVGTSLWMLFAAVGVLLLIVCANLANLLLARAANRAQEMAVRSALGASRGRLARQLLAEGLLLSLLGGGAGVALAAWGLRVAAAALPPTFPYIGALVLNPVVAAYGIGLALATGVLLSLAPMLLLGKASLRSRAGAGRHRLHSSLMVAEVAMAMALLTAAGLMLRSMEALDRVDLGFDPHHVLTETVSLYSHQYQSAAAYENFFAALRGRAASLPGVESTAIVFPVPYTPQIAECFIAIQGRAPDPNAPLTSYYVTASASYFPTLRLKLLRGRVFTAADEAPGAPPVVVVDQSLAEQYWGSMDRALGQQLQMFTQTFGQGHVPPARIVGVVGSFQAEGADIAPNREVLIPLNLANSGMTLLLRSAGDLKPLGAEVRTLIREMNPDLAVPVPVPLDDLIARSESTRLVSTRLLVGFALAALLLAALGLYGVLAYLVEQRRRELGIRIALGASRSAVQVLVLRQGVLVAALGVALGGVVALVSARWMASLLFEVRAFDGVTLIVVATVLLGAAALASYLPARHAASVDPLSALKVDR